MAAGHSVREEGSLLPGPRIIAHRPFWQRRLGIFQFSGWGRIQDDETLNPRIGTAGRYGQALPKYDQRAIGSPGLSSSP